MLARRSASALRAPADQTTRLALLLCLASAACAPPSNMIQEPRLPPCRGVVDVNGRSQTFGVTWFGPASGSDRRAHAEWCGTVGPLVIKPDPSAAERRASAFAEATADKEALPHNSDVGQPDVGRPFRAASDEIAIVSWNVHVGGGDLIALVSRLRAGEWSNGRPVTRFVLLLQEVFRRGPTVPRPLGNTPPIPRTIRASPGHNPRVDVLEAAERLGLSLFYAPSMRNGWSTSGQDEDRGSAILATDPLSDFQVIELPFERQRRVALAATLHIASGAGQDRSIRVCSVHLDNRVTHRRLYLFAPPGRTRQIKGLLDALPSGEPLILGGDFNTWLGKAEGTLRQLRRAFPDTPRGKGTGFGLARLDYLFFRLRIGTQAEWRVLDESFGSDHRPVLGWVRRAAAAL